MNDATAIDKLRACLTTIRPDADIENVADDTPLLEARIISSFDVVELILHLENMRGRRIARRQLVPDSFRDLRTIARVFLGDGADGL